MDSLLITEDKRFKKAVELFNSEDWYPAHDAFEELWHEASCLERATLQALVQVSVAQIHLEQGNTHGATILYGEGLGRLRANTNFDLGIDLEKLCSCLEHRLKLLQAGKNPEASTVPFLHQKALPNV